MYESKVPKPSEQKPPSLNTEVFLDPSLADKIRRAHTSPTFDFFFNPCETRQQRELFIECREMLKPEKKLMLTPYSLEDYNNTGTRLFLSFSNDAGFGISSRGELTSVFALNGGYADILLNSAISLGATEASCFDINGRLPRLYNHFGFREVFRSKWDPALAPDGWNYERFGTPDVIIMHLEPTRQIKRNENNG